MTSEGIEDVGLLTSEALELVAEITAKIEEQLLAMEQKKHPVPG